LGAGLTSSDSSSEEAYLATFLAATLALGLGASSSSDYSDDS